MITISNMARDELNKVITREEHKDKNLYVNFMGYG